MVSILSLLLEETQDITGYVHAKDPKGDEGAIVALLLRFLPDLEKFTINAMNFFGFVNDRTFYTLRLTTF